MNYHCEEEFSQKETSLVQKIAKEVYWKYCPAETPSLVSIEDLTHFGIVGMLEAKKKYDPSRGTSWLSFASFRIRGAMIDHLRKLPLVRLPQAVQQKVKAIKSTHVALSSRGETADPQQIAKKLGWTLEEVYEAQGLIQNIVGIDDGSPYDSETESRREVIESRDPGPLKNKLRAELARLVNECLKILNANNRLIILGRFLEGLKLKDLATTIGCTQENIRIRQNKALLVLKDCLEEHGLPVEALDDTIVPK